MVFNNNPKITVITVVYNDKENLKYTIRSIKKQIYRNIEYIIIDGGSTDGTIDVIKDNEEYVTYWLSEPDRGIYDAMNKGVQKSSGDYINFMNAGDTYFETNVLLKTAEYLVDSADVVYGDHWVIGSRRSDGHTRAKEISKIKYGMPFCHQSTFYKREIFANTLYSLDYKISGDYDFNLRLFKLGCGFKRIKDLIICYYKAGGISDVKRRIAVFEDHKARETNNINCFSSTFIFLKRYFMTFIR